MLIQVRDRIGITTNNLRIDPVTPVGVASSRDRFGVVLKLFSRLEAAPTKAISLEIDHGLKRHLRINLPMARRHGVIHPFDFYGSQFHESETLKPLKNSPDQDILHPHRQAEHCNFGSGPNPAKFFFERQG